MWQTLQSEQSEPQTGTKGKESAVILKRKVLVPQQLLLFPKDFRPVKLYHEVLNICLPVSLCLQSYTVQQIQPGQCQEMSTDCPPWQLVHHACLYQCQHKQFSGKPTCWTCFFFAKTSVSETVQTTHGLDLPKNMVKLFDLPNTLRDKHHLVNIMITIWQHFFTFIFSFFETLWFPLSKNKLIGGLGWSDTLNKPSVWMWAWMVVCLFMWPCDGLHSVPCPCPLIAGIVSSYQPLSHNPAKE